MSFERCKARMLDLVKQPGNDRCADCGDAAALPDFISLKLGVFVCINCSGIHRSLGVQFSNAKSIKLDTMSQDMCNQMENMGNEMAKTIYQYNVPECWPTVKKDDPPDLIEQWIRAKYERQEFVDDDSSGKQTYATGSKYGWLIKKEKAGNKWNKRYFILSTQQGYLCYFLKQDDSEPKQRIHISHINIMFIPDEVTGKKHSLLLSFPVSHGGYTKQRHIYIYSESGFEIIDWYLAIRAARLHFLRPYLYGVDKPVVDNLLSRQYIKIGYLYKTGSKNGDGWKKRFICIDTHKFSYFKDPVDAEPAGEVDIESNEMNCFAMEGVDGNHPQPPTNHAFFVHSQILNNGGATVRKPVFNFCASSREDMLSWLQAFRKAMKQLEWLEPIKDKSQRISILSNFSSRCFSES